jgi:Adenylate and Guanylate cyclase catalytic domain
MESTGTRDKIQISQSTADLLIGANKSHWIKPRDDAIDAKGKGMMQTYWLSLCSKKATSSSGHSDTGTNSDGAAHEAMSVTSIKDELESKEDRLVDWMVELLVKRLKPMVCYGDYFM